MNKPNERHELFCREYVRRPVGRAAAVAAGYGADNAAAQACRLLARDDIQGRIAALRDEVAARQVADSNAVLARLQSIYELALEQNQLNIALRAVAMQVQVSAAIPAGQKPARSPQAARPAETPDFDAILDAIEASLPPAGATAGNPPAPPSARDEPDAAPERTTKANKSQSFDSFPAARDNLPFLPDTLTARVALSGGLPGG